MVRSQTTETGSANKSESSQAAAASAGGYDGWTTSR